MSARWALLSLSLMLVVELFHVGIFVSGRSNHPRFPAGRWGFQEPSLAPTTAPSSSPEHKKSKKAKRKKSDSQGVSEEPQPTIESISTNKKAKKHGATRKGRGEKTETAFVQPKQSHESKRKKQAKKRSTSAAGIDSDSHPGEIPKTSRPKGHSKIKKARIGSDSSSTATVRGRKADGVYGSSRSLKRGNENRRTFSDEASDSSTHATSKKTKKLRKVHTKPVEAGPQLTQDREEARVIQAESKKKSAKKRRKAEKKNVSEGLPIASTETADTPVDESTPGAGIEGSDERSNLEDAELVSDGSLNSVETVHAESSLPGIVVPPIAAPEATEASFVEESVRGVFESGSLDPVQVEESVEYTEKEPLSPVLHETSIDTPNTVEPTGPDPSIDNAGSSAVAQVSDSTENVENEYTVSSAFLSFDIVGKKVEATGGSTDGPTSFDIEITPSLDHIEEGPVSTSPPSESATASAIEDDTPKLERAESFLGEDGHSTMPTETSLEPDSQEVETDEDGGQDDESTVEPTIQTTIEHVQTDEPTSIESNMTIDPTSVVGEGSASTDEGPTAIAKDDSVAVNVTTESQERDPVSVDATEEDSKDANENIMDVIAEEGPTSEQGGELEDEDDESDASEEDVSTVMPPAIQTESKSPEPKTPEEKTGESPDDPYLDPDVVHFIGNFLNEDIEEVRAWTNAETSSSTDSGNATTSLNETRGGSQVAIETNVTYSDKDRVKLESENTVGSLFVESDAIDSLEDKGSTTDESKGAPHNIEAGKTATTQKTISLDRNSLEASEDKETDAIVSIVTWNLAEESPAEDDAVFIREFRKAGIKKGTGSDLILISGQECENIKPRRSEGRRSREYRRLMIKMLGKDYVPIALHLLGGIQFGLFAKRSFLKEIEHVSIADVTCGIGNVFHNKGAIAAFVQVKARNPSNDSVDGIPRAKSLRMMFVTAHMAAHVKNADARDADFWRISSELEAQAPEGFLPGQRAESQGSDRSFLFDSVDRAFFCGDLNYRVDLPREVAEYTILMGDRTTDWMDLMKHDQLFRTMTEGRAFPGFAEGKITFAPTFKFDKETGEYDTSHKQRIPAWTDRILFKPWGTRVLSYDSVPGAQHSDHRPVKGTFRVNMEGRELPPTQKRRKKPSKRNPRE